VPFSKTPPFWNLSLLVFFLELLPIPRLLPLLDPPFSSLFPSARTFLLDENKECLTLISCCSFLPLYHSFFLCCSSLPSTNILCLGTAQPPPLSVQRPSFSFQACRLREAFLDPSFDSFDSLTSIDARLIPPFPVRAPSEVEAPPLRSDYSRPLRPACVSLSDSPRTSDLHTLSFRSFPFLIEFPKS